MSWVTILLSMVAAACLTLAGMHLLLWLKLREARENLLFTIAAMAAAATAMLELQMMQAPTPADYGEMLRWMHLSVATVAVAVVWFVYFYLRAGRRWLAWSITGLRLLILVPNFLLYQNATFVEISSLRHVMFLGEPCSVPIGEVNPWRLLTQLGSLLLLVFVIDAAVSTWKRGRRQPALVLGGATLLAILLAVVCANLMVKGVLPGPFISLNFLLLVLAMAYLLLNSLDALNGKSTEQRQIIIHASQTQDGMIEFAVIDRGNGIAPEQLPHLFEPFYTTRENGTGIGLAISKTIVDIHGGRIMAKNNPDGGATVSFTLKQSNTNRDRYEG